jgi:predicted permease
MEEQRKRAVGLAPGEHAEAHLADLDREPLRLRRRSRRHDAIKPHAIQPPPFSAMLIVAVIVLLATALGVSYERRTLRAGTLAQRILALMLYVLVPFVSFVNIAHLRVTLAAGSGLGFGYLGLGVAGGAAWLASRSMRLSRPQTGAEISSVILVNTGYLGYPMTVALLGGKALGAAVVYDQLVSGPMLFVFGFGVGAAFGTRAGQGFAQRARAFVVRNPPLLAVIAGLLASPSLAPEVLLRVSHVIVYVLLPLGFFVVGVNLSAERRAEGARLLEPPDARVGVAVILRLTVTPLVLAAVSAAIIRLPAAYLLQAAMPSAVNGLLVGQAYGLDQRLIATAIVWSTAAVVLVGLLVGVL